MRHTTGLLLTGMARKRVLFEAMPCGSVLRENSAPYRPELKSHQFMELRNLVLVALFLKKLFEATSEI